MYTKLLVQVYDKRFWVLNPYKQKKWKELAFYYVNTPQKIIQIIKEVSYDKT